MTREREQVWLMRRELAAIFLLANFQPKSEKQLDRETDRRWKRTLMTSVPTLAYLWTDADHSAMNDFFRKNSQFESKMVWGNQASRIVKLLRDARLVSQGRALTLTETGKTLYRQLIDKCGVNPLRWPDLLEYNLLSNKADWDDAQYSPEPASYREHS